MVSYPVDAPRPVAPHQQVVPEGKDQQVVPEGQQVPPAEKQNATMTIEEIDDAPLSGFLPDPTIDLPLPKAQRLLGAPPIGTQMGDEILMRDAEGRLVLPARVDHDTEDSMGRPPGPGNNHCQEPDSENLHTTVIRDTSSRKFSPDDMSSQAIAARFRQDPDNKKKFPLLWQMGDEELGHELAMSSLQRARYYRAGGTVSADRGGEGSTTSSGVGGGGGPAGALSVSANAVGGSTGVSESKNQPASSANDTASTTQASTTRSNEAKSCSFSRLGLPMHPSSSTMSRQHRENSVLALDKAQKGYEKAVETLFEVKAVGGSYDRGIVAKRTIEAGRTVWVVVVSPSLSWGLVGQRGGRESIFGRTGRRLGRNNENDSSPALL